jgi:hypothetical protein
MAYGCKGTLTTAELPDREKDGTKVMKKTYGGGKGGRRLPV